ncbi:hypothetical protein, partial [Nonomuraea cypriaca]|uniref:hypothetical protein n=1 Tax=Nonomuraea cypriaca TaxID=1187855 RepID=UPI001A9CB09B
PKNATACSRVPMAEEQPPSNRPGNRTALTIRFAHEGASCLKGGGPRRTITLSWRPDRRKRSLSKLDASFLEKMFKQQME